MMNDKTLNDDFLELLRTIIRAKLFKKQGPGYMTSLFLLVLTKNFQDQKKSTCSYDPKAQEAHGGPKKLLTNISALCPLQDLQKAYLWA